MLFSFFAILLLSILRARCSPISTRDELQSEFYNSSIVPRDGDPDLSILAQLFNYKGCNADDKKAVNRAFADAIDIAAAVAPSVDDVDKIDPYLWHNQVWFGKYDPVNSEDWDCIKSKQSARGNKLSHSGHERR